MYSAYTDHSLPSDSIMAVDAYDRSLDTCFTREGNYPTDGVKRKNEKADLEKYVYEKITGDEYTLDWSQSKVFLPGYSVYCFEFTIALPSLVVVLMCFLHAAVSLH